MMPGISGTVAGDQREEGGETETRARRRKAAGGEYLGEDESEAVGTGGPAEADEAVGERS